MAVVKILKMLQIFNNSSRLYFVNLSQCCCHLNGQHLLVYHFSFFFLFIVCAHTSHYHLCAVACVCSIFINSYFYSKPCWFQSIPSKSGLQSKYQWEEQWENWQLWKGRTSLPDILSMWRVRFLLFLLNPYWFFDS